MNFDENLSLSPSILCCDWNFQKLKLELSKCHSRFNSSQPAKMCSKDVVGIYLASSGSRGDHLLFRYPIELDEPHAVSRTPLERNRKNPYALKVTEDYLISRPTKRSCIENGQLVGFSDQVLANLMAVKNNLCGDKFEVKIDDVIFIGFPMMLHPVSQATAQPTGAGSTRRESPTIISFNMVLALQASVSSQKLECYHDLTKQLAVALRHEERRCGLLSKQKNIMWAIQDEVAGMTEDSMQSPYKLILDKCDLAKQLKVIYENLCSTGVVQIHLNKWIHINWCLPQKVQTMHYDNLVKTLRPYHGILLLIDENSLLESLPIDASPSLQRLVRVCSPFKNLQNLAADADLSLAQVCQLVIHLVYWNKAMIIYPLCEANMYVLSPSIRTGVNSALVDKFEESFPSTSLLAVLADFSVPTALGDHKDVLDLPQQQEQEVQIVTWLLQHGLLVQLHTYVFLVPQKLSKNEPTSPIKHLLSISDSGRIRTISNSSDLNSLNSDDFSAKSSITGMSDIVDDWLENAHWHMTPEQIMDMLKATDSQSLNKGIMDNLEDIKLFSRLSSYFDGKHHLEEIMYRENVRRSQLLTLLDKFRDVLITCQHEDPGVSGWVTASANDPP